MKVLRLGDGTFVVPNDQKVIKGVINPESWDKNFLASIGIYDYVKPELGKGQILGELYLTNDLEVTNYLVDFVESTTLIYESRLGELELIRQGFLSDLTQIHALKVLTGEDITAVKTLTQQLLLVEERVKNDLQEIADDLTALKAFRFNTEEMQQFKNLIEALK